MGFVEDEDSALIPYETLFISNSSSNIILQKSSAASDSQPFYGLNIVLPDNDSSTVQIRLNDSSILDHHHRNSDLLIAFLIQGVSLTLVCMFGLIGNLLTVMTFSRIRKKSSFTCLLLGLTFCDSLLILCSIFIFGFTSIFEYLQICPMYSSTLYPYIVVYLYPVAQSAQTGSVYFTLVVTLERWFVVCQPLKTRDHHWATWKRGVYTSILILVWSFLFNVPRWWEYRVVTESSREGVGVSKEILRLKTTDLRMNKVFVEYYMHYAYMILIYIMPITILVCFNWIIHKQIRLVNKTRQELSVSQKSEISLAFVLVIIVVVFLLCNFLPLLNNIMELYYNFVDIKLLNVANFLVALNSSVNVLIYYTTLRGKYRKYFYETCYKFFCCCRPNSNTIRRASSGEMRSVVGFTADRRRAFNSMAHTRTPSISVSGNSCARSSKFMINSGDCRSQSVVVNHQSCVP